MIVSLVCTELEKWNCTSIIPYFFGSDCCSELHQTAQGACCCHGAWMPPVGGCRWGKFDGLRWGCNDEMSTLNPKSHAHASYTVHNFTFIKVVRDFRGWILDCERLLTWQRKVSWESALGLWTEDRKFIVDHDQHFASRQSGCQVRNGWESDTWHLTDIWQTADTLLINQDHPLANRLLAID